MKNLNYPTWESGIPQLLPEINPYRSIENHCKYYPQKNWKDEIIGYTVHNYSSSTHIREYHQAKDAWSYMEILQWLRDKEYKFVEVPARDGLYQVWYKNELIWDFYKDTYYEALDEAIIYTLNLLKNDN